MNGAAMRFCREVPRSNGTSVLVKRVLKAICQSVRLRARSVSRPDRRSSRRFSAARAFDGNVFPGDINAAELYLPRIARWDGWTFMRSGSS